MLQVWVSLGLAAYGGGFVHLLVSSVGFDTCGYFKYFLFHFSAFLLAMVSGRKNTGAAVR